jgi:hypothetical protein
MFFCLPADGRFETGVFKLPRLETLTKPDYQSVVGLRTPEDAGHAPDAWSGDGHVAIKRLLSWLSGKDALDFDYEHEDPRADAPGPIRLLVPDVVSEAHKAAAFAATLEYGPRIRDLIMKYAAALSEARMGRTKR